MASNVGREMEEARLWRKHKDRCVTVIKSRQKPGKRFGNARISAIGQNSAPAGVSGRDRNGDESQQAYE